MIEMESNNINEVCHGLSGFPSNLLLKVDFLLPFVSSDHLNPAFQKSQFWLLGQLLK
jgi:hypothetical protein